ncbi:MAG: TorF family putative porin [Alphaproteobacteria bacterium]|nr:TorF family putative porin [Alphaproteobacteria bacterium]
MKKQDLLGVLIFYTLTMAPLSVQATTNDWDVEISGNVGFVTEYSFRGIAQSDEHIAVQGGFDISHGSGLHAGVWGSNVDFNDGDEAHVEVDVYGGYSGSFHDVDYDIGVIYYAYPGADSSLDYDFWEGSFALGYDFDVFSASASINYSPEYFGNSGDAQYYALGVDVPLPADFTLSGHVGYQEIDDNAAFGTPDYTDWSVGLGYTFEGFDLSLQYVDTDLDEPGECADGCDSRVIFGIDRSF